MSCANQIDEINTVLQEDRGIRYMPDILKELNDSLFYSRTLFVSFLFSGTCLAAIYYTVEKFALCVSQLSSTPSTGLDYEKSIDEFLECRLSHVKNHSINADSLP